VKVSSVVSAVSAAGRLLDPVSDIKERHSGAVPDRKAQDIVAQCPVPSDQCPVPSAQCPAP
jgi:hypothetical protein